MATHARESVPLSFLDLGCGTGSLIVLAHTIKGTGMYNIASAIGVEVRSDLHEAFLKWMAALEQSAPWLGSALHELRASYHLADILSPEVHALILDADVIWCNNKLFSSELNHAVARTLAAHMLKPGATVISTSPLEDASCKRGSLILSEGFSFRPDSMSWTPRSVPGYVSRQCVQEPQLAIGHGDNRSNALARKRHSDRLRMSGLHRDNELGRLLESE